MSQGGTEAMKRAARDASNKARSRPGLKGRRVQRVHAHTLIKPWPQPKPQPQPKPKPQPQP